MLGIKVGYRDTRTAEGQKDEGNGTPGSGYDHRHLDEIPQRN